jgi:hypothetical protein
VDGLDLKVDQLCQLANRLLEHNARHQNSSPAPPVVTSRVRAGNHFRVHRHRQFPRSRPASQQNSSEIDATQPSALITDQSRESLLNLYCLFQDNLNSSKTDLV